MSGEKSKIVLSTSMSLELPPYKYASIEMKKVVEIHGPIEGCAELAALEKEAEKMKMNMRNSEGKYDLAKVDAVMTEFVIRRFRKFKKELDELPAGDWYLAE